VAKQDYFAVASAYIKGKALAKGERYLKVILRHNPKHAHAWFLLGYIWMERQGWALAKVCFEKALAIVPTFHEANNNLGICNRRLDRTDAALSIFRNGLETNVNSNLLSNLGSCSLDIGNFRSAENYLRRAQVLSPDHNDANWNLALSLLVQRKWREAWALHHYGFRANERGIRPYLGHWPQWQGQDLRGKTILIWGEQGIGDEILFAGCFNDLKQRAQPAEVIFDCHPRLAGLYRGSFPWMRVYGRRKDADVCVVPFVRAAAQMSGLNKDEIANLVRAARETKAPVDAVAPKEKGGWARFEDVPDEIKPELIARVKQEEVFFRWNIDYHLPIGDLPKIFRNSDRDFPLDRSTAWMKPDPKKVELYRNKYPTDTLRIGLCWLGGSRKTAIHRRSIPLEKFSPILKLPATWLSLQYGDVGYEVQKVNREHGVNLIHDDEAIENLDDLAALTKACDLVISVIQTQVHMAGAMGVETWCLTCHAPPWKFHDQWDERDTLLWHPAVRMIRQEGDGTWRLDRLKDDIQSLLVFRHLGMSDTAKTSFAALGNTGPVASV
jgi:Flp pilus assembly protein TadD